MKLNKKTNQDAIQTLESSSSYTAPLIEVIHIPVEYGFCLSTESFPSDPVEEWN